LRRCEFSQDGVEGVPQTFAACLVDYRFHKIGPLTCLLDQTFARALNRSPFGSGTDQRCRGTYQHPTRLDHGHGHFSDDYFSAFAVLQYLLHAVLTVLDFF
jgi:hypothetical protein